MPQLGKTSISERAAWHCLAGIVDWAFLLRFFSCQSFPLNMINGPFDNVCVLAANVHCL